MTLSLIHVFDRLLAVLERLLGRVVPDDLLVGGVAADRIGHLLDQLRVGQLDVDRARQRVLPVQRVDDVGRRGGAELLERLLLVREAHRCHAVEPLDEVLDRLDIGIGGIVGHVGRAGHLALHRRDELLDDEAADEEHADDQQRQEDGHDGSQRRRQVAREALEGLLDKVEETRHRNRTPPAPGRGCDVRGRAR